MHAGRREGGHKGGVTASLVYNVASNAQSDPPASSINFLLHCTNFRGIRPRRERAVSNFKLPTPFINASDILLCD